MIRETVTTRFCCQRSAGRARENVRTGRSSFFIPLATTLVELIGLEPTTYGLQSRRSPD